MSSRSEHRPTLRVTLATLVAIDLVSFYFFISEALEAARAHDIAIDPVTAMFASSGARAGVVAIGVAGVLAFARRPGRLWHGLVALGALVVLSTVHAQLFGGAWRHLYYSGACLAGWLLGLVASRRAGIADDESYARTGAIALLSAAYCNAAISKFVYGGVEWLSGAPIQAIIVSQDGLVGSGVIADYRRWTVAVPAVASFFSVATMVFELGAPLMLLGGWVRIAFALGLFAMHANIYVLTPILYWESMVLLLVFGLSRDAGAVEAAPSGASAAPSRLFPIGAALLAVWAALAIWHQGHRYTTREAAKLAARQAPPPPAPTAARLSQVGPFIVGAPVTDGWTLQALELSESGFIATLTGGPGPLSFEVTCATSEHQSPFDLEDAHIFYSSALEFSALQAAGVSVRERVREAAAGGDVCAQIAAWRASAR